MKKIIIIMLILISTSKLYAQIDNFRQELDFLFGQLDKTKVSSGYLAPYGIDGVDKADFNGVLADSNTVNSLDLFRFIYADILTAKFNPTAPTLPSINLINQTFAQQDKNTLAIFYANYNELNESSIQLGLMRYIGGKLYDNLPPAEARIVFPQAPKPYIARKLFVANPLTQYFDNTVTLKLNPSLFFNNANVTLQNLWVNFGNGYSLISSNSSISNTYTDSSGFHRIAIKAELSNGDIMETYTAVMVKVTTPITASRYTFADLSNPDITVPATANQSGCRVYIRRSINTRNLLGQNTTLVINPFIVAEGLDTHDAAPGIDKTNYDVNNFIREIDNITFNSNFATVNFDDIGQYDLVFIDWNNGVDDIRRNAAAMEIVINAINARKVGTRQNVVMGISMGGLVARYCLADMTKRSVPTQTRLLITHDSPHLGAYVPLGLQHIVTGLQNKTILGVRLGSIMRGALDQGVALLNSPAAQQQLIMTSADENGNVNYNTFLSTIYRPMVTFNPTGPQPQYRFIATSQGSQCGVGTLPIGYTIADGEAQASAGGVLTILTRGFLTRLRLKIAVTVKGLKADNLGSEISYFRFRREASYLLGLIPSNKTFIEIHRNEPVLANPIPWESVPGGTRGFTNNTTLSFANNWNFLSLGFLGYDYNFNVTPYFSFLPTISALDVVNPNGINKTNIFSFNASVSAPQNLFNPIRTIAQEQNSLNNTFNIPHTDFTSRNARWIFNEMQNGTALAATCDDYCTNPFVINGNDFVCTSSTYSVDNLPPNAVVTWSITSGNSTLQLAPNNPVTNQLTITNLRLSEALGVTLIATINIQSCTFQVQKTIGNDNANTSSQALFFEQIEYQSGSVLHPYQSGFCGGPPVFLHQGTPTWVELKNYNPTKLTVDPNVYWSVEPHTFKNGFYSPRCLYMFYQINSTGNPTTFRLNKGSGSCSDKFVTFFQITNNGRVAPPAQTVTYLGTPNPVSDILNIKVLNTVGNNKNLINGEYTIQIAELNTNLPLKQFRLKKTGGDFQINMAGFKSGYYAVEINDGKNRQVLKIYKL